MSGNVPAAKQNPTREQSPSPGEDVLDAASFQDRVHETYNMFNFRQMEEEEVRICASQQSNI